MKPEDIAMGAVLIFISVFGTGLLVGYNLCRMHLHEIAKRVDPRFAAETFGYPTSSEEQHDSR